MGTFFVALRQECLGATPEREREREKQIKGGNWILAVPISTQSCSLAPEVASQRGSKQSNPRRILSMCQNRGYPLLWVASFWFSNQSPTWIPQIFLRDVDREHALTSKWGAVKNRRGEAPQSLAKELRMESLKGLISQSKLESRN